MAPSSYAARRNSWPFFLFGKRKRKGVPVHVHDTNLGTDLLSPAGPGSGIENPTAVFLCQQQGGKPHKVDNEITLLPPPPRRAASEGALGASSTPADIVKPPPQQAKQLQQQTKLAASSAAAHPPQSVDPAFCTIRPQKPPAGGQQPFGGGGGGAVVGEKGGGGYVKGRMLQVLGGEAATSDGRRSSSSLRERQEEHRRQQRQQQQLASSNNNTSFWCCCCGRDKHRLQIVRADKKQSDQSVSHLDPVSPSPLRGVPRSGVNDCSPRPRSWTGVVVPQPLSMSGRQPIAPRLSLGSAAKHAQPPPSPPLPKGKRRTGGGGSLNGDSSSSGGGGGGRNGGRKNGRKKMVIISADMEEELQKDAVDCATRAMDEFSADTDIAAFIKKDFDKNHGNKWHCIVGRNFGSFVTHDAKHFIYLYRGQVAVLLFKAAGSSTAPPRPAPPRPTPAPRSSVA